MFDDQIARLNADMDRTGEWPADSPWVHEVMTALPRHLFAPELLYRWDGHTWLPVDRGTDSEAWASLVYGGPGDPAITQITAGMPSSSLSCPGVVADMLDSLEVEPGQRVLELGTGTGWNAGLIAWRVGVSGRVVSVEVDPGLAAQARQRLDAAGVQVAVEVGDGAVGWAGSAPYDRIISTYAVDQVPWSWVEQTRPGGLIVTPWGRLGHVALTVADDGRSASGWVHGLAQFMPARGTSPRRGWQEIRGDQEPEDKRPARDPAPLRDNVHLLFALRVALPDVQITTGTDENGAVAWICDGTTSWATLTCLPDGRAAAAYQGGPRRLADEIERAWGRWLAEGQPELYDWGMTVEPERQYVWCRDPETGPRWPVSAQVGLPLAS